MTTITLPRATVEQALEALELGYDTAKAEADRYHTAMAGYRPERHAQIDAEVQQIAAAITNLRDAMAQQVEPLTIERLRDALVASRIIQPAAVEDPDGYDDGVTLFRIEALHRRIT